MLTYYETVIWQVRIAKSPTHLSLPVVIDYNNNEYRAQFGISDIV